MGTEALAAPAASGRVGLGSGSGVCVFQDETRGSGEQLKPSGLFSWQKGAVGQGKEGDMGSDNNTVSQQ